MIRRIDEVIHLKIITLLSFVLIFISGSVVAEDLNKSIEDEDESPWLLMPIISSEPKLGTTLGLIGAYINKFDEESPASMFGIMGKYSDTDSYFYGAFTRSFFDSDKQRINVAIMGAKVNNNYEDFQGSGLPATKN